MATSNTISKQTSTDRVIVAEGSYDRSRLEGTISELLDDFKLDVQGKTVLVKPNMLGPFDYRRGITTHPSVVAAVASVLKVRGARALVGDNPGMHGYGENLYCAQQCGLYDACRDEYVNLSERPIRVPTGSRFIQHFLVSKEISEVDMIITVPKFKTHIITTITGAVKNSFGFLIGGQKSELHRRVPDWHDFNEVVVDVFETRIPDFAIVDAIVGMEGIGPSSKDLRNIRKIIAGANCVTVDSVMAMMMGLEPGRVETLSIANKRGLGQIEREKIEIEGDFAPIPDFKLPSSLLRGFLSVFLSRIVTNIMVKKPVVDVTLCQQCGLCAKQCPVDALELDPFPVIDQKRCISCFCCYEYCKENAIKLRRSVRFLRRRFG